MKKPKFIHLSDGKKVKIGDKAIINTGFVSDEMDDSTEDGYKKSENFHGKVITIADFIRAFDDYKWVVSKTGKLYYWSTLNKYK